MTCIKDRLDVGLQSILTRRLHMQHSKSDTTI